MKKTVIALVALPRSGTTLTAAMLDVHDDVVSWFEPWHAREKIEPRPLNSIEDYAKQYKEIFGIDVTDSEYYVLKETCSKLEAIKWIESSLENIAKNDEVNIKIIWLVRNINHVYLSRIEGARKWWGNPQAKVDEQTYQQFIRFAFEGFISLCALIEKYDSILLSYEYMLQNIDVTLVRVMEFLGAAVDPKQFEYHKHFETKKSAGDLGVSRNPRPPTFDTVTKKNAEWEKYSYLIDTLNVNLIEKYSYMNDIVNMVKQHGVLSNKDFFCYLNP